jgi:nucleoside phosphorylase
MRSIVDYLIVIPLDEEFGYVRNVVERIFAAQFPIKTIGAELYGRGLISTANGEASVVILSVGRMTEAPVQSAVEAAVRTWRPATVILVGIAGSLDPDKVRLGDIFIPKRQIGDDLSRHRRSRGLRAFGPRPCRPY